MDHLLFCKNHPDKIAKRHCKKCDQNICNECVFDFHIEHNSEIEKLEYSIDTKNLKITQILSKDIESIINKSLNDLKPQIYKLVLEKTEEYIKNHKNIQLKLSQKPTPKQNIIKDDSKNQSKTTNSNPKINERAKMFEGIQKRESQKIYDENNPYAKKVEKQKNVLSRAKMFDQNK